MPDQATLDATAKAEADKIAAAAGSKPAEGTVESALNKGPQLTVDEQAAAAKAVAEKAAADKLAADNAAAEVARKAAADKIEADAKAAADKVRADAAAAAAGGWKLELPKDSQLGAETLEATVKQAKELGLNEVQAKALLTSQDAALKSYNARIQSEFKAVRETKWKEEILADPELGGALDVSASKVILAKTGLQAIMRPDHYKRLEASGFADAPEFLAIGFRYQQLMIASPKLVNGSTVIPDSAKPEGKDVKSMASRFYPDKK